MFAPPSFPEATFTGHRLQRPYSAQSKTTSHHLRSSSPLLSSHIRLPLCISVGGSIHNPNRCSAATATSDPPPPPQIRRRLRFTSTTIKNPDRKFCPERKIVHCGLRNGVIVPVDLRERPGRPFPRLTKHKIRYQSSSRTSQTTTNKKWFKLEGNITTTYVGS